MSAAPESDDLLCPTEWGKLERLIQRFEEAWQQGQRPVLEEFLPSGAAERRAVLIELVHADLECRLKAGEAARVETYFERYPELRADRKVVLDLLAKEFDLRRRREANLTLAEYPLRFPEYRAELLSCLNRARRDERAAGELERYPPTMPAPTPPTLIDSVAALVQVLHAHQILEPVQLDELTRVQESFRDPHALGLELLRRGWLTAFQLRQLFLGKGPDLALGSYVLLEQLSRGGMGQIYKARHRRRGRVVALKMIRSDLLANEGLVRRFHREVRAAAQLNHPHVVSALDAGLANGIHFLAMEYIDGINLAQLIRSTGPLPIDQACDYIRQAALGLQHLHECGLIHRDVKPTNLLRAAKGGVIKLLDLGLARLHQPGEESESGTTLTHTGMIMGTPDYIAPEQTEQAHTADVRSDLYGLGCTLYHLLTGQVPFPGGSVITKMERHRWADPRPLEELRPESAEEVVQVVRKLMAKRPEARYQMAADVAAALAALTKVSSRPVAVIPELGGGSQCVPANRLPPTLPPTSEDTLHSTVFPDDSQA